MINATSAALKQIPLIHIVDEDDQVLLNSPNNEWFKILHYFPWEGYCEPAAQYYDALYHFNCQAARKRKEKEQNKAERCDETKENATQRLLFDRATMDKSVPVIHEEEFERSPVQTVNPTSFSPGVVPLRIGGKKPVHSRWYLVEIN